MISLVWPTERLYFRATCFSWQFSPFGNLKPTIWDTIIGDVQVNKKITKISETLILEVQPTWENLDNLWKIRFSAGAYYGCKYTAFHWFSVQFSCSVVSDSLQPHESQHVRTPCPPPTPGVYPNSCLSSWWCHPAILSSVVPISPFPQSLPALGSFPMSQLQYSKVLEFQLQHQSFQRTSRTDLL